ncbi:ribosome-associated ATPase/putative transporter RbbA [Acetobacter peroxydans]|jgi:ribosome-dependent ATPase|uniref:ribosome-associated ATPase/putative transporter RbbA n=1 Tax=Acetobacter peroxydans TaxID=104098 RepID=UPI002352F3A7|nr:ribosome-associated ATPase/putative transporter RbbA [Acetobacter peroxydans]MCH4143487.1 ribosome-associated ATPase/putative transporter RbbA [Acetobacter peroxydans]MCI1394618.1 ribosome-associated ATPase/putative transporter RbbA [Acetobacter peroxydans]MCI1411950.1 ribosome-associated ATPase/putative transporter RbbA [Acetobacter peroxydans]MCI1567401.1 ribosome-associated ATPase/putative transporter RbbA [Acetobacter peroxydans]MCI1725273.1 ribosome-associated ATPase/putative transport
MSTPAAGIEVSGVSHRYRGETVLHDLSLSLPAGQTIALVGPDGVGKSTLLGLIAGVRKLQSGRISTLGVDIANRRAREQFLPRLAFMPQGLGKNLYPTLSVRENIDFFGRLFALDARTRETQITHLLNATGLAPFPDRPAGQLSGGMKQKLSLCCALVHEPDLLILDEPTTGVDPLSRRQFWALVEQMRHERPGMTILVSTAYMEEADRFSWLVAMNDGHILACDETHTVLEKTGTTSVEAAYVSLLPASARQGISTFEIPPYTDDGTPPVIEAENLTRQFGSFTAVDHVSFRIHRGEIFGFLGSNGCGKSTTMKMLTGLLDITSGSATLFGRPISAGDMNTRMRVGYMSQAFSLYEELSVRQNLVLQARLFRLPATQATERVNTMLKDFELTDHADERPTGLPLGYRQRLQLAAACINNPDILILDEPTSGVDPAARDMFWKHLVHLSRNGKVTIFVSTHFMNEAMRCDRISLMDKGRVLAKDTPQAIIQQAGATSLEDAFIIFLEKGGNTIAVSRATGSADTTPQAAKTSSALIRWLSGLWAFARRETVELLRDRLRLAFAILGPVSLLLIAAYSVSFDINTINYTVVDHDQSQISRTMMEQFRGSRYFHQTTPTPDLRTLQTRLRHGEVALGIDVPVNFGRDMLAGRNPELGIIIDGAMPFMGANIRAYVEGTLARYGQELARTNPTAGSATLPFSIAPRFAYNQEFRSIYAITPGVIMLALILIPTMLTALGVVREKEIGSIMNLYASPASTGQYLLGKQLPYVGLAILAYLALVFLSITLLGVPLKGSFTGLSLGALFYILASTGFGLLISTFVRSQVAAIFGTAIICLIPAVNFSGLLYPTSTLVGIPYYFGEAFPATWFQLVSLGAFTKGLGVRFFIPMYAVLVGFACLYIGSACLLLRKQDV